MYDKIHLRRQPAEKPQEGRWLSLGEMLKQRAEAGVRVCIMVWDDKTSLNSPVLKTDGLMMVHDEDTKRFFADSKVRRWGCHSRKHVRRGCRAVRSWGLG